MRVKQAIKRAAVAAGRLMPRPDPSHRRAVLCYHSVHPDRRTVSSPPDLFERHLAWLNEHCRVVSLVDLVGGAHVAIADRPVVSVTFDDGYGDNHAYALPLLLKHRVPATFFVTAGFLERDPAVLRRFEDLVGSRGNALVPLDWAQARELRASGMDVGSHTYSHPNLARLSRAQAEEELRVSKAIISDRMDAPVELLAYPFGKPRAHVTAETVDLARAAGYRVAAAVTFRGVAEGDSPLRIPRFFTDGDSLDKLANKVGGAYDLIGRWQEHAPLPLVRLLSPLDFER